MKVSVFQQEQLRYRAIDSLSAEKNLRHWHADLSNRDTPLEAGESREAESPCVRLRRTHPSMVFSITPNPGN